ncbi:MAG: AraC-like DNA-binding protein [Paracoccaceae bacterium]
MNGIKAEIGFDADVSVSVDSERKFCRAVSRAAGDDWFFWNKVLDAEPEIFGFYSHLALTAPTLGDAFESLSRNINKLVLKSVINIDDSSPAVTINYSILDEGTAPCRELSEAVIGFGVLIARTALGPDWRPDCIQFEHPRPATITPYQEGIESRYEFNAPAAAMTFDRSFLSAPMPGANIYLQKAVENYIANVIAKRVGFSKIALDVRAEIAARIDNGLPTIDDIAICLRTSPRTLQRRLHDAGTTYSDVLEELRLDLADRMLVDGDMRVSEIGYLLGYADLSSFDRAYRAWTGHTPAETRRKASAG